LVPYAGTDELAGFIGTRFTAEKIFPKWNFLISTVTKGKSLYVSVTEQPIIFNLISMEKSSTRS
jgi:hypothetical protein